MKKYGFYKRNFRKQIELTLSLFLLVSLLSTSCLFRKIDKTPYQQTDFYRKFQKITDTLIISNSEGDFIRASWAKVNITPQKRVRLAGYGSRFGKKSTGVHDSLFVRAFVFENGKTKTALITSDLLIMPPEVIRKLTPKLPKIDWNVNQLYFSATHTHNATGGWAKHVSGSLIAGKHRRKTIRFLTDAFLKVLPEAEKNLQPTVFAFVRSPAPEFVNNRLIDTSQVRDTYMRTIFIRQVSGKTAVLTTFQAHPTCLEDKTLVVSGDYPSALTDSLEKTFDFAAFCAGGVGSHSPNGTGNNFEKITSIAAGLSQKIKTDFQQVTFQKINELNCINIPLPLRKPAWRAGKSMEKALRPGWFYLLFGKYESRMSFLQIGNTVFAGMPCDFSGLLTEKLENQALLVHKNLIITSFNGGYIGYITPDEFYNLRHYETKDMNWFGAENGAYFSEVILKIISRLDTKK